MGLTKSAMRSGAGDASSYFPNCTLKNDRSGVSSDNLPLAERYQQVACFAARCAKDQIRKQTVPVGYSKSSNCQNRIPEQIKSRKDWRASPKHFTGAWRRPKNQSPGMELEAKLTFQWEGFSAEGLESCVPFAVFPSHCFSYLLTHLTK